MHSRRIPIILLPTVASKLLECINHTPYSVKLEPFQGCEASHASLMLDLRNLEVVPSFVTGEAPAGKNPNPIPTLLDTFTLNPTP